jgi:hypothetical protein
MRRFTGNLGPEDRQLYWKFVGGLFGFYGVLVIAVAGVLVGHHWSKNRGLEPAMAVAGASGVNLPVLVDAVRTPRHAAKSD